MRLFGKKKNFIGRVAGKVKDVASKAGDKVSDVAESVSKSKLGKKVKEIGGKVSDKAHDIGKAVEKKSTKGLVGLSKTLGGDKPEKKKTEFGKKMQAFSEKRRKAYQPERSAPGPWRAQSSMKDAVKSLAKGGLHDAPGAAVGGTAGFFAGKGVHALLKKLTGRELKILKHILQVGGAGAGAVAGVKATPAAVAAGETVGEKASEAGKAIKSKGKKGLEYIEKQFKRK